MDSSSRKTGASSTTEGGPEKLENYITGVKKLAAVIGCTQQTALKHIQSGKIVAVPVGGSYRIYESELLRFLRHGNHPNPQPLRLRKPAQGETEDVNDV